MDSSIISLNDTLINLNFIGNIGYPRLNSTKLYNKKKKNCWRENFTEFNINHFPEIYTFIKHKSELIVHISDIIFAY